MALCDLWMQSVRKGCDMCLHFDRSLERKVHAFLCVSCVFCNDRVIAMLKFGSCSQQSFLKCCCVGRCGTRSIVQCEMAMGLADPPAALLLPLSAAWGHIMLQSRFCFLLAKSRCLALTLACEGPRELRTDSSMPATKMH